MIQDLSGSWCIKGTDESMTRVDSPVPLMHHDPSDLGSLIRIWITPEERTLNVDVSIRVLGYVDRFATKSFKYYMLSSHQS